jgi:hypothetical protein
MKLTIVRPDTRDNGLVGARKPHARWVKARIDECVVALSRERC